MRARTLSACRRSHISPRHLTWRPSSPSGGLGTTSAANQDGVATYYVVLVETTSNYLDASLLSTSTVDYDPRARFASLVDDVHVAVLDNLVERQIVLIFTGHVCNLGATIA